MAEIRGARFIGQNVITWALCSDMDQRVKAFFILQMFASGEFAFCSHGSLTEPTTGNPCTTKIKNLQLFVIWRPIYP